MADDATTLPIADGVASPATTLVNGKLYMTDPKGALVPVEAVKPVHKLEDELVRKVLFHAEPLSAQIARFREHTFDDVDQFVALLEQEHGAKRGGSKGNMTFISYDGLAKVQVAVADQIVFGPELQVAKALVDECLADWAAETGPELRTLVTHAFNVDQAGKVNRAALLSLRRYDFADERWKRAMVAIREAERPIGSKRYVRIYHRAKATDAWEAVAIDAASA